MSAALRPNVLDSRTRGVVQNVPFEGARESALMKVRQIISMIERDGWHRVDSKGGHRQYKHPSKKGRVTISGHANDDVHSKTLNSILKQAGLK